MPIEIVDRADQMEFARFKRKINAQNAIAFTREGKWEPQFQMWYLAEMAGEYEVKNEFRFRTTEGRDAALEEIKKLAPSEE